MIINISKNGMMGLFDIIAFILLFIGVRYTADWAGYEMYMNVPELCPDVLFSYIAEKSSYFDVTFLEIYRLHIVAIAMFYVSFVRRYTNHCFLALLFFILLNYVYVANQIRFFLAMPLTYFAIVLYINKKFIKSILLLFFASLSHQSMPLLFVSGVIVYGLINNLEFKKSIIVLFVITLASGFLWKTLVGIDKFSAYQDIWSNVSVLGGLWQSLPTWLSLVILGVVHSKVEKYNNLMLLNVKYKELLVLSLTCVLFLGIGFNMIIYIERFCLPLIIVWMIYFIYVSTITKCKNIFVIGIIVCFMNILFAYMYPFITGKTYLLDEMINTVLSYTL